MGFPKFTQTLDHTFANKDAPSTSCTPSQSTYRCFMTIQARFVASCKASDLCFRKIRCTLLLVDRARPAQTSPIITYADPARGNLKFASIVSVVKGLLKLPQLCANCGLGCRARPRGPRRRAFLEIWFLAKISPEGSHQGMDIIVLRKVRKFSK